MSSVFVIVNEWVDDLLNTSSEVTGGVYYTTELDAWEELRCIAANYGVTLLEDETSIQLEDHSDHLQSEEYYIQELTPSGN